MRGAELHIIHVWQAPPVMATTGFPTIPFDMTEAKAAARETLEQATIEGLAAATPLPTAVATFLMEGPPATALLDAAKDADLLVVGRRGHGGISRLVLGSVSMHCLRHTPVPIAIVHEADLAARDSEEAGHG